MINSLLAVHCLTRPSQNSTASKVFSEGTAPLTCLADSEDGSLYVGSWDKNIHAVKLDHSAPTTRLTGHTDFVKCLLAFGLGSTPILISGGADSSIMVWDTTNRKRLHKIQTTAKAIQDLAIDPLSLPEQEGSPADSFVLFTASNGRDIRRYHISLAKAYELEESVDKPILAHETSVYKLRFDSEGDLWTASADKTAKHLVRSRNWEADTTLQHPDFVRDIVIAEEHGVVVTACRDEEVRVWDIASGSLVCTYSGHYEEVTSLALIGSRVVSGSIDGTVRRWGLSKKDMAAYVKSLGKEADVDTGTKKEGLLSAEEEAELAELMDDDE